jgi:hypothetical protein
MWLKLPKWWEFDVTSTVTLLRLIKISFINKFPLKNPKSEKWNDEWRSTEVSKYRKQSDSLAYHVQKHMFFFIFKNFTN